MLELADFKRVVQHAPLFAIDLVVLNESNQILLGQRLNAPAKNYWFVPGGRVYKNESLEQAIARISIAELGIELGRKQLSFLGLYDHFYKDSFVSDDVSTHYINATHAIKLNETRLALSKIQHDAYRWVAIEDMEFDKTIHQFSKVFLSELKDWLNHD